MALPKPLRKIEVYLYALATGEKGGLPKARTRAESYLKYLAENLLRGRLVQKEMQGKELNRLPLQRMNGGCNRRNRYLYG